MEEEAVTVPRSALQLPWVMFMKSVDSRKVARDEIPIDQCEVDTQCQECRIDCNSFVLTIITGGGGREGRIVWFIGFGYGAWAWQQSNT